MKVLTPETMAAIDRRAIEEIGIPGPVLMENAALGVVDAVAQLFPEAESVAIFCGPGNNGGDGFAVGRHLALRGYRVELFLWSGRRGPQGDARLQHDICRRQGLEIAPLDDAAAVAAALEEAATTDLLIDALFGTGLGRPLEGVLGELVHGLNHLPAPRLAVDLPSGLQGGRWQLDGPAVAAEATVTFAAPKVAHVLSPAADRVGELVVADLGMPRFLLEEAPAALELLLPEEVAPWLGPRPRAAHKGSFGHVLIAAGGLGRGGAAVLAGRGAVGGGAGLVTLAVPEPALVVVDGGCLEAMAEPLPVDGRGRVPVTAGAALLALCDGKAVLAMGPGFAADEALIRDVALAAPLPLVLDAEGLNAFAGRLGELRSRPSDSTVLTPHPGELGRLLGISSSQVQADRPGAARQAAADSGAVVVLKGHQSLIADPAGRLALIDRGNPGMATGGSGDVLTGLLAARWAQGDLWPGVCSAVFLHALAGDLAAADTGQESLAAGDLVAALGAAFRQLEAR
ncbi:MAG: NAD(P)H-hydrate dehydratase [Acidobacteriota bacterium]